MFALAQKGRPLITYIIRRVVIASLSTFSFTLHFPLEQEVNEVELSVRWTQEVKGEKCLPLVFGETKIRQKRALSVVQCEAEVV